MIRAAVLGRVVFNGQPGGGGREDAGEEFASERNGRFVDGADQRSLRTEGGDEEPQGELRLVLAAIRTIAATSAG